MHALEAVEFLDSVCSPAGVVWSDRTNALRAEIADLQARQNEIRTALEDANTGEGDTSKTGAKTAAMASERHVVRDRIPARIESLARSQYADLLAAEDAADKILTAAHEAEKRVEAEQIDLLARTFYRGNRERAEIGLSAMGARWFKDAITFPDVLVDAIAERSTAASKFGRLQLAHGQAMNRFPWLTLTTA